MDAPDVASGLVPDVRGTKTPGTRPGATFSSTNADGSFPVGQEFFRLDDSDSSHLVYLIRRFGYSGFGRLGLCLQSFTAIQGAYCKGLYECLCPPYFYCLKLLSLPKGIDIDHGINVAARRRLPGVRIQSSLTAAAMNLKKLVTMMERALLRMISGPWRPLAPWNTIQTPESGVHL